MNRVNIYMIYIKSPNHIYTCYTHKYVYDRRGLYYCIETRKLLRLYTWHVGGGSIDRYMR